ncbi:MAG: OB-fold nucleic acid binding domain-containing protein [Planctomycetota bacterium]|nr:OB-fold nucleic acid binding domain-containing protein [Planctomycetota bacterium]RLS41214.1 MAG: HD domain-containing protein [Planctomycetota bacterium]
MARRTVGSFREGEQLEEVFQARDKQLRANRNGNLYLQLDLADRTGLINCRMWNAGQSIFAGFDDGDLVRIRGRVQAHQGALQVIATCVEKASLDGLDPADFQVAPDHDADKLLQRALDLVRSISLFPLRALGEAMLLDPEIVEGFRCTPAGVSAHHAYPGGLLEHVASMMEVADRICPLYTGVDRDLVLIGCLVHDIGKIRELSSSKGLSYTDEGQLLGHMALGQEMISAFITKAEALMALPFPPETRMRVLHMLHSHHGALEFGSTRVPMTPEAVVLHQIDLLDSRVNMALRHLREDRSGATWTPVHSALQRRFYRGGTQA